MKRITIGFSNADDRKLTVLKQALLPEILAREVRWLAEHQGPGIAALDRVNQATGAYSTCFAGSHTLATWGDNPLRAQTVLVALVPVLGRLHSAGHGHGMLRADHIVIGVNGPTLISPDPSDRGHMAVQVDLIDLGRLVAELSQWWRVLGSADEKQRSHWVEIGDAIGQMRPGRHGQLINLVNELGASKPMPRTRWRK